jgi:tetratricopeptide (TPR) repeat protein
MPYGLTRHDYTRWQSALYDALLYAMDLRDEEFQIQIWSHLGNYHFQKADYRTASTTFHKALEHCNVDATPEIELLARIGMLRAKTIFATSEIEGFINDTLQAARSIESYHLLGKLYYTLAVAYTHQAETRKALGYGQMALACWYKEHNTAEKERTALALAETSRVAMCFEQARRYLALVPADAENDYLSGIYRYHQGSVLLEQNQIEDALPHVEYALRLFKKLDFPYMTGAAYHLLALVQTKLDDFDIARENLRRAIIIWQRINNVYEQVSGIYALGFLEERANRPAEARSLYIRARELMVKLPDTPLVSELRKEIEAHLATVH